MMGLFVRPLINPFKTRRRAPKYALECPDFDSTSDDYGRFISLELYSEGNNLSELIENASFSLVDQDGGERGMRPADSHEVEAFIVEWFLEQQAKERK